MNCMNRLISVAGLLALLAVAKGANGADAAASTPFADQPTTRPVTAQVIGDAATFYTERPKVLGAINDLIWHDGLLHVGTGSTHSRNIRVRTIVFDPATGAMRADTPDSLNEEILTDFAIFDGQLWAPGRDDVAGNNTHVRRDGKWVTLKLPYGNTHNYALAVVDGTILTSVGIKSLAFPGIAVSTDGGKKWTLPTLREGDTERKGDSLFATAITWPDETGKERAYFLQLGGGTVERPFMLRYDGGKKPWTPMYANVKDLFGDYASFFHKAGRVGDRLIIKTSNDVFSINRFDGKERALRITPALQEFDSINDVIVVDGVIYALSCLATGTPEVYGPPPKVPDEVRAMLPEGTQLVSQKYPTFRAIVWQSGDAGATWTSLFMFYTTESVNCFERDPAGNFYFGLGEINPAVPDRLKQDSGKLLRVDAKSLVNPN
jgi:hypothetical protein